MAMWDPWRDCHRYSEGCKFCYIHKGDARRGVDTNLITKTDKFDAPITRKKNGEYKMKPGLVYVCFSSDFLLEDADPWRQECWDMIRQRKDCRFLFLTKRIDRFLDCIPENWSFSKPRRFVPFAPEIAHLPADTRTIEGTLTVAPDGRLLNIMRFENTDDLALLYAVNTEDYDAPLEYAGCMKFPAHRSKFMIKYDPCSRAYYSIATRIYSKERPDARNLLSPMVSKDLQTWTVAVDMFDYREENWEKYGFQYVDFEIEGDDIIYLCRTALNEAHNLHDTNYQTFHRLKNFRQYAL